MPPNILGVIEFLDEQTELVSGVIYLSNEKDAIELFSQRDIYVHKDALIIISDAKEQLLQYPPNLTVIAVSDRLGRVFNLLKTYLNQPTEVNITRKIYGIWGEIMANPEISTGEIWRMLHEIPGVVEPFVQLCLVTFLASDIQEIPYNLVMKQLMSILPNCYGTVRSNEIILLLTYKERRFDYPFNFDQVTEIIEKHNGYMCISNGTRDLSALRILYHLSRRIITIAVETSAAAREHIFTFERFGTYLAIDLCAKGFLSLTHSEGFLYLAHPAIVALKRNDLEKKDNLSETLYSYLFNDCNITATAKMLHMHRNTVINKIKKISHQFKLNLEDKYLRQRLIFSFHLIEYFENNNKLRPDI